MRRFAEGLAVVNSASEIFADLPRGIRRKVAVPVKEFF
jgi:hypothetical protein